jgi:hypothetical protein
MPPEALPKYHAVIESGKAEFVNGTRLCLSHRERGDASAEFHRQPLFCVSVQLSRQYTADRYAVGTKVLLRKDYEVLARTRGYGDFDLIFGAAKQNLRSSRRRSTTRRGFSANQISRFRDGWLLLKMVWFAYRKLNAI